jgi:hypothetical protein
MPLVSDQREDVTNHVLDYAAQIILALQCLLAKKRNASVQLAIPIL